MSNAYATSHIDGGLDCSDLSIGILKIGIEKSPVVYAKVISGQQLYPFWALDRLAVVIYCYAQAAKKLYPHPEPVQVNVNGTLVGNQNTCIVVARSITWHTSEAIRNLAELTIVDLTASERLIDHWPTKREISLPVNGASVGRAQIFPHNRTPRG